MEVKLKINFSMRNEDKKEIVVKEKDPKGYLVDKETGERKEISLTDKEVQVEYSKKIATDMEKKRPLFFIDENEEVHVINSYDISSVSIEVL